MRRRRWIIGLVMVWILTLCGCDGLEMDTEPSGTPDATSTVATAVAVMTPEPTEMVEYDEEYTIEKLTATMYATANVNIRDLPSTDGEKIGRLKENESTLVTGQCVETDWYRVDADGEVGYISNKYLTEEIPRKENSEKKQEEKTKDNEERREEEEKTEEEPTKAPKPTKEPEEKQEEAEKESSSGGKTGVTVPSKSETEGNLVWVPTQGGTKYHTHSGCSNMEGPVQVSIETAKANGFTACKRCH